MKRKASSLILAGSALCTLFLAACELPLLAGGSSSTETGKKVNLVGRVTGDNGEGLPGVAVALSGSALADTTDLSGAYRISGRKAATPGDTLRFTLHGQSLARRIVASLQDTVPELRLVQRGFSGKLRGDAGAVARIEGVLKGDGIATGDSVTATFYHNVPSNSYSGFVYFPVPGDTVLHYTLRVDFYDGEGVLLQQGPSVAFTSLAGNITLPNQSLTKRSNASAAVRRK